MKTTRSYRRNLQIRSRFLDAPRLVHQVRLSGTVLACLSAAQRPRRGDLDVGAGAGARLQGLDELSGSLGCEVFVVVVVDLDHGGVDAGSEAFNLDEGEEPVRGGLALLDAQFLLDCLDDDIGAAASKLTRRLISLC